MVFSHVSPGGIPSQSTQASRSRRFSSSSSRRTNSLSLREYEIKTSCDRGSCLSPGAAGGLLKFIVLVPPFNFLKRARSLTKRPLSHAGTVLDLSLHLLLLLPASARAGRP